MQTKSLPYLTTLTPLRGIAAVLMVIYHSNLMLFPFMPPGYTKFLDNGWLWVDFFFILSGFIMCYAYGRYFYDGIEKNAYKKYIGARFARIYPLHFITTIWAFICVLFIVHFASGLDPFLQEVFNPKALPASIALVQSMHIYFTAPLNTPSWSLSTEWWAYVLFPLLVPYFARLKTPGKLITALLIIALYVACRYLLGPVTYFKPGPTLNVMADYGFLRCLAGFFTGMLLFTLFQHRAGYPVIKRDWFFMISFLGVIAAMHFGLMDILIVCFFPFVLLSAAYNQTRVKRILDTKILQRLGDWSFAIYMVHMPLIFTSFAFSVHKNPALFSNFIKYVTTKPDYIFSAEACIVLLTLTLIIAALMHRFVEIPARNYFNRLFDTKHKVITTAVSEKT
jgi:peptidoglycan/LPS O-acetylase OafA/YrhL